MKPDAVVWKGDHTLSPQQQGIRVLGALLGSAEYVESQLEQTSVEQETLFHRIPQVQDTQASWLLLLMCGATRSNFWLRMVRPDQVQNFAERHDLNVFMLTGIDHEVAPCFQAVRDCADTLREAGLVMPTWRVFADTTNQGSAGGASQTHRKHFCGRNVVLWHQQL